MIKKMLVFTLLICFVLPAYAKRTVVTKQPYYGEYYNQTEYKNLNGINDLEQYVFNRNYTTENNLQRLCRLETAVFGTIQTGDIYNRYENVRSAVFEHTKQNYNNSILKSLGNYFTGQLTGFTPPVYYNSPQQYSSNPYQNSYSNGSFTEFSGPSGRGYRYNDYSRGAQTGVRILDN